MRSRAAQLLFSAVFLLLACTASARLTPPPLPDFQDTAVADSAVVSEQTCPPALDWAALEADLSSVALAEGENAVLAVLLVPFDDPENAYIALIPCDPQNRVYRLFRDLQPPLGLASENVSPELLERVQTIADDLVEIMPSWVRKATPQQRGTWLHTQLERRLGDLDNVLILTESSIDKAGRVVSRGTRGNPIPDIVFLKSGANREALLSGAESLAGHVDAVVDLKTGVAGIKTRWGRSVGRRLGLGLEDIHTLRPGGALVDDFARAPAVRGLASRLVKRGAIRTAGKAIIVAGVLFAYQHAKAEGMDDSQAAAYAAASVYGGDLVYDGTKWACDLSWNAANDFARGSSAGQYVQAIESAVNGQSVGGPTVDASGRKLETILRSRTPTAGDSLLLIDQ